MSYILVVEAFALDSDGDLDVSRNGVIRTLTDIDADLQSAIMLIANKKGSYGFDRNLGLDEGIIFNYQVVGQSSDESMADIAEYLIKLELMKDPNFGTMSNFTYERIAGTRKLKLTFDITLSNINQNVEVVL